LGHPFLFVKAVISSCFMKPIAANPGIFSAHAS
jgi:hypothetical protein